MRGVGPGMLNPLHLAAAAPDADGVQPLSGLGGETEAQRRELDGTLSVSQVFCLMVLV